MQIIECEQRSEIWENARRGIPTASQFNRITYNRTKDGLGKTAEAYLYQLIADRFRVYSPPPPTYWMEWGEEHEEEAVSLYEAETGLSTKKVGFCLADGYGGSPDRFVGEDGLLEVKCPAAQTHIEYTVKGELPGIYRDQVYGCMWIAGREWCDFASFFPSLPLFRIRIHADEKYIKWLNNFEPLMQMFLEELDSATNLILEKCGPNSMGERRYRA